MKPAGKIDISKLRTPPLKSEFRTAKFLAALGKDIEFILPSETKYSRTPDIVMDGIKWEIKCPTACGKHTIQHAFRSALGQSANIIFDLRSAKQPLRSLRQIRYEFSREARAKHVVVIMNDQKVIDITR